MNGTIKALKALAAFVGCPLAGCLLGLLPTGIYLRLTESDFVGEGILILFVCALTTFVGLMVGFAWAIVIVSQKPTEETRS